MSAALVAKDKGNAAFKAGSYVEAIGHYTTAILADRTDETFPLNRAAAYLKLGKHADAERDCNTVLSLNSKNVKALFRRAQARVGMEKLSEGLKDLNAAYKLDPTNQSVKAELKRVGDIMLASKAKTKSPADVAPQDPPPHPRRRRVPITIVDSTSTPSVASTSATPVEKPKTKKNEVSFAPTDSSNTSGKSMPAPPTQTDKKPKSSGEESLMTPVSSRILKKSAPTSEPILPSTSTVPTAAPTDTFKSAKHARNNLKPSLVGGGIFRASGENTIFGESDLPKRAATTTTTTPEKSKPITTPARPATGNSTPTSLFDFRRAWEALRSNGSQEDRWGLICSIPPNSLPNLFKTSLDPTHLASILESFRWTLDTYTATDEDVKNSVRAYIDGFSKVPRFGTVVLFMSEEEKAVARDVLQRLGDVQSIPSVWSVILK